MSREEILRRFQEWLDGALASEEPPRGIEAEILAVAMGASDEGPQPPDAYSLRSAMTALAQEVKLQGRAFKDLNQTFDSQADRVSERERALLVSETERRCRKEVLGVLIDLRDRLMRGLDSVRTSEAGISKPVVRPEPVQRPQPVQRGWLARIFSRGDLPPVNQPQVELPRTEDNSTGAMLAALKKGYELSLDRLDQTLEEFQAHEIRCVGQVFDPRRMNAIDSQESSTIPDGTVIEVYRSGYEWNGEVFRAAQVKVAHAPAGREHE